MIPPARREALPSGAVMLIWLAAGLLALVANWSMLGPAHFGDGDDALRLQQVRDLLAGQGWYDLTQHRIAPPGGVPMHWTRVVDLPLALVIVLLRPLIGMAQAGTTYAVVYGVIARNVAANVTLVREGAGSFYSTQGDDKCALDEVQQEPIAGHDGRYRLSARGYHRVLRVARTLADLDNAEHVGRIHLAEALSYRALNDEMRKAA